MHYFHASSIPGIIFVLHVYVRSLKLRKAPQCIEDIFYLLLADNEQISLLHQKSYTVAHLPMFNTTFNLSLCHNRTSLIKNLRIFP